MDSVPVKYVVLDNLGIPGISERYAAPTVESHPHLWKLIYVAPGGGARSTSARVRNGGAMVFEQFGIAR